MSEPPKPDGGEFPPFDPNAPIDYPTDYPGPRGYPPLPPPVYPAGYPGYGYDPYAPGGYGSAVPPGTNGKAIASLACAVVGLVLCMCFLPSIAAIVLGIIAMSETRRTGQAGYNLAVAGLVIGALAVLMGMFFMMVSAAGS
jgi:hypothetical protein